MTRLRKASQPKTSASRPGTSTTSASCSGRLWAKAQTAGMSEPPTTPKICEPMESEISCEVGGNASAAAAPVTMASVRAYISHMPIM